MSEAYLTFFTGCLVGFIVTTILVQIFIPAYRPSKPLFSSVELAGEIESVIRRCRALSSRVDDLQTETSSIRDCIAEGAEDLLDAHLATARLQRRIHHLESEAGIDD